MRLVRLCNFLPTSGLLAPPGTGLRGLVHPHPLLRRPLQEHRPRNHPCHLPEAHHVKWVSRSTRTSKPAPHVYAHPRPLSPPGSTAPASRAVKRLPHASRLPGRCVALRGHWGSPCRGPAHPGLLATPSPARPGPLLSLRCPHCVSTAGRSVHRKKARGKPAARSAREQGEGGRPRAHLRSAGRPV